MAYVDIDALLRRVYGHAKHGARFGHAKVGGYDVLLRGLSPLVATVSTPLAAPVVAATRLRNGAASSMKGAASLLTEALSTARAAGATGQLLVRADSQFYAGKLICAARRAGARVSITVGSSPARQHAINAIPDGRWQPVHYPQAVLDPDTGELISDAQVAETGYTAFAGTKHAYTARLVVRRVRDRRREQNELFPVWRYHPFFTDTAFSTVDADITHRAHAVVETVFCDLIDGPLAHLPSVIWSRSARVRDVHDGPGTANDLVVDAVAFRRPVRGRGVRCGCSGCSCRARKSSRGPCSVRITFRWSRSSGSWRSCRRSSGRRTPSRRMRMI